MSSKTPQTPRGQHRLLPSMIVFDLDDCLWSPEMHELPGMPEIPIHGPLNLNLNLNMDRSIKKDKANDNCGPQGVVGLKVARYKNSENATVRLFDGARQVLYELATNPIYKDIVLAAASSSLEPSYSYACLDGLEILPSVTMGELFSYHQIGRTGPLSPNKLSHFRLLHEESNNIPYEEMLFFDDCNWGDHCGNVSKHLGVVSKRTPHGLQWHEFQEALQDYRDKANTRGAGAGGDA